MVRFSEQQLTWFEAAKDCPGAAAESNDSCFSPIRESGTLPVHGAYPSAIDGARECLPREPIPKDPASVAALPLQRLAH